MDWQSNKVDGLVRINTTFNVGLLLKYQENMSFDSRLTVELCIFYMRNYFKDIYFNITLLSETDLLIIPEKYEHINFFIGSPSITNNLNIINKIKSTQFLYELSYYYVTICDNRTLNVGLSYPLIFSSITQLLIENYKSLASVVIVYDNDNDFSILCLQQSQIFIDTYNILLFWTYLYKIGDSLEDFNILLNKTFMLNPERSIYIINCMKEYKNINSYNNQLIITDVFTHYPKVFNIQLFFDENILHKDFIQYCNNHFDKCMFVSVAIDEFFTTSKEIISEDVFKNLFDQILHSTIKYSNIHDSISSLFSILKYTLRIPINLLYMQYFASSSGSSYMHPDSYLLRNVYITKFKDSRLVIDYNYMMSTNPYVVALSKYSATCYWQSQYIPRDNCNIIVYISEYKDIMKETFQYLNIIFTKLLYSLKFETNLPCIRGTIVQYYQHNIFGISEIISSKNVVAVMGCITDDCRNRIEKILFTDPKPFFFIGYSNGEYCSEYIFTMQLSIQEKADIFLSNMREFVIYNYIIVTTESQESMNEIRIFLEYTKENLKNFTYGGTIFYHLNNFTLPNDQPYIFFNFLKFPNLTNYLIQIQIGYDSIQYLFHYYQNLIAKSTEIPVQRSYFVSFYNDLEDFSFQGYIDIINQFITDSEVNIFYYSIYQSFLIYTKYVPILNDLSNYQSFYQIMHDKNSPQEYFLDNNHYNIRVSLYQIIIDLYEQKTVDVTDNRYLDFTINCECKFLPLNKQLLIPSSFKMATYLINGIFLLYIAAIFALFIFNRHAHILKAASLSFLLLILIGVTGLVVTNFTFVLEPMTSVTCYFRIALPPIFINFIFILFFFKTYRIYRIFYNTRQIKLTISNEILFYKSGIYMFFQLAFITLAFIIGPVEYHLLL